MTSSNAGKINEQERNITMTTRRAVRARRKPLTAQRRAGLTMLVFALTATALGGDFCAAAVLVPPALAALFSKEKLLDFGIFGSFPKENM